MAFLEKGDVRTGWNTAPATTTFAGATVTTFGSEHIVRKEEYVESLAVGLMCVCMFC